MHISLVFKINDLDRALRLLYDEHDVRLLMYRYRWPLKVYNIPSNFTLVKVNSLLDVIWYYYKRRHKISVLAISNHVLMLTYCLLALNKSVKLMIWEDGMLHYRYFDSLSNTRNALLRTIKKYLYMYVKEPISNLDLYTELPHLSYRSSKIIPYRNELYVRSALDEIALDISNSQFFVVGGIFKKLDHENQLKVLSCLFNTYPEIRLMGHWAGNHTDNLDEIFSEHDADFTMSHGVTFEVIAPYLSNVKIFSLGSSVLLLGFRYPDEIKTYLVEQNKVNTDIYSKLNFNKLVVEI